MQRTGEGLDPQAAHGRPQQQGNPGVLLGRSMWAAAPACKSDFALLATADVSFAHLFPRADGLGLQLVGSPLVDVVGWSTGDGATGVALTAGRRADNFTLQTMQLAGPDSCTVGVTGAKVCISSRGPTPATWLLVFADMNEMHSLIDFLERKNIAVVRAELYARSNEPPPASKLEDALKDTERLNSLLKAFVATPGWSHFVDEVERAAHRNGIDLSP